MRIRFQVLLPFAVGLMVAGGFVLAAAGVAGTLHEALLTVPGVTRERAVEAAMATLTLAGIAVTGFAVALAAWLGWLVASPLRRLKRSVERMGEPGPPPATGTILAEVADATRAVGRAGGDLRNRHARERQERDALAALVEAVSEGIMRVAPDGRVLRVNAAGRALLGLPPDTVGRPASSLLRNEEVRRLVQPGGDGSSVAEVVLDDRRIFASSSPQPDGGVVATFVDLTDLRRLEEVRRDFVANASHELKTPLTSIRGYAETLLAGDMPERERRQFLETLARNADRLHRVVDDLLDLSRLDAGRWRPQLAPTGVIELAVRAWASFTDRAEAGGVAFRTVRRTDQDSAMADERALEQVFANLFDNALRHTPAGGTIEVRVRREGKGRPPVTEWVVAEIADTGTGIPRDALPRIFERFYRVDPARSRAEGGTGLGLSIVRHMVESMGGEVTAESVLGKGTTLRVRLPAAD